MGRERVDQVKRTPADRIAHVEMTEAERWSGSTILLDKWCPRDLAAAYRPEGV